jgi:hypothetical protein
MAASRPLRPVGESNNVISLLVTGLNADVCQSEVDRFVGLVHNGHRESSAWSTAEVRGNPVRRVTSEQNRSMTGASWDAGYWTFVPDRKVNARLPASNRIGPEITECRTGSPWFGGRFEGGPEIWSPARGTLFVAVKTSAPPPFCRAPATDVCTAGPTLSVAQHKTPKPPGDHDPTRLQPFPDRLSWEQNLAVVKP